jgi:hypothetical protein
VRNNTSREEVNPDSTRSQPKDDFRPASTTDCREKGHLRTIKTISPSVHARFSDSRSKSRSSREKSPSVHARFSDDRKRQGQIEENRPASTPDFITEGQTKVKQFDNTWLKVENNWNCSRSTPFKVNTIQGQHHSRSTLLKVNNIQGQHHSRSTPVKVNRIQAQEQHRSRRRTWQVENNWKRIWTLRDKMGKHGTSY